MKYELIKEYIIQCEVNIHNCMGGESFSTHTLEEAKKRAKEAGWIIGDFNTCPRCQAKVVRTR